MNSPKLTATIQWKHVFHGDSTRAIIVAGDFWSEHAAKSFVARILPEGTEHKIESDMPTTESFYVVAKLVGDQADLLTATMEDHRIPDHPPCRRCGEQHGPGDLAHSIDWAQPYTVQFEPLEHPGQAVLPGCPR